MELLIGLIIMFGVFYGSAAFIAWLGKQHKVSEVYCSNSLCVHRNRPGARYCSVCGMRLPEVVSR